MLQLTSQPWVPGLDNLSYLDHRGLEAHKAITARHKRYMHRTALYR